MIWAILGATVCAYLLGSVIGWKLGYDDGVQAVYDHRERKAVK